MRQRQPDAPAFRLAMGLPPDIHPLDLLRRWRDKRAGAVPFSANMVKDGPILGNVQQGDEVNIESFPAPRWHPGDGGRYIGSQDMVIVRDPEEGWVNLGCYRAMIQSRDRISLWINPQKHGRILAQKYWKQGRAFGTSEYDLASAIAAATGSFVNRNSTTSTGPEAVIRIQRIYYRDDPITTLAGTMFRSM